MAYKKSNPIEDLQEAANDVLPKVDDNNDEKLAALLSKIEKVLEYNKKLEKINDSKDKEIEKLKTTRPVNSDREITVGCNDICGITLSDKNNNYRIPVKYCEEVSVLVSELKTIIRSNNAKWRKFFESGLLYFTNDEDYGTFGIKKNFSMDETSIKELLMLPEGELRDKLLEITSSNRDSAVVHALFYRIIALFDDNKLNEITYRNREIIEDYFACKIRDAIYNYKVYKQRR